MKFLKSVIVAAAFMILSTQHSAWSAGGSEKGNGQLIVKVGDEWMPLEAGVVYRSKEYYGLKHLMKVSEPSSRERQFAESLLQWFEVLKEYSPVEAALFETHANKVPWIIVQGEIGIGIREYPDQAVKFIETLVAGVFHQGKIYLSVPNILKLERIPRTDRVKTPDQGFVMIHELINLIYSRESAENRLDRGKEIAKILIEHTSPAQYQAQLVYSGRASEGVSHLNTPLELKIATLKEILKDSGIYDIYQSHRMPFKVSAPVISKMERIREVYAQGNTPTLWNGVRDVKTLREMEAVVFDEGLDLESLFQTATLENRFVFLPSFLKTVETLKIELWDALEGSRWFRSFPKLVLRDYEFGFNPNWRFKGVLSGNDAAYRKFSPYIQDELAKLLARLKSSYVSPALNGVAIQYCLARGEIPTLTGVGTSPELLRAIIKEQESCLPFWTQSLNHNLMPQADWDEIFLGGGQSPEEAFLSRQNLNPLNEITTVFVSRVSALKIFLEVLEARVAWKETPNPVTRNAYFELIQKLELAQSIFHAETNSYLSREFADFDSTSRVIQSEKNQVAEEKVKDFIKEHPDPALQKPPINSAAKKPSRRSSKPKP